MERVTPQRPTQGRHPRRRSRHSFETAHGYSAQADGGDSWQTFSRLPDRTTAGEGFEKILLLLGYLPQVVQDYFGDGSRWGIKIEYSISAVDDETARRLKLAESLLDPYFLLLYCDNYWPMQIDKMWQRFIASGASASYSFYLV